MATDRTLRRSMRKILMSVRIEEILTSSISTFGPMPGQDHLETFFSLIKNCQGRFTELNFRTEHLFTN